MSVEILIRADHIDDEQPPLQTIRLGTGGAHPILFADPHHLHHNQSAFQPPMTPYLINEVTMHSEDDEDVDDAQLGKKSRVTLVNNLFILAIACMAMQTAFLVNNSASTTAKNSSQLFNYYHMSQNMMVDSANSSPLMIWTVAIFEKLIKVFDCLIVPQYLIRRVGVKSTIFLSFLSYLVFYLTTKFYPLTYASYLGVFLNECNGINN